MSKYSDLISAFQFIFAVIAVQLFNGKFFFCSDESKRSAPDCQGQFFLYTSDDQPPVVVDRVWQKQKFHYDNVAAAMLTLFAVQTTEGWPAVLQHSMAGLTINAIIYFVCQKS